MSECKYYKNIDGRTGECMLNPPSHMIGNGNTEKHWLYPIVESNAICQHYVAKTKVKKQKT